MCFATPDMLLDKWGTNYFTSDSLPDSDPTLLEDLAVNVQSILRRSLSNSESITRPAGNQVKTQDAAPLISSMSLTPSENISFLVEI